MAQNRFCLLYVFALPLLLLSVIGFGLLHASALRGADGVGLTVPPAPPRSRAPRRRSREAPGLRHADRAAGIAAAALRDQPPRLRW